MNLKNMRIGMRLFGTSDSNQSPRQAFIEGIWKGLGAPVMLYAEFPNQVTPEIQEIIPPGQAAGVGNDWATAGRDIRTSISRYGKELAPSK